MIPFDLEVLLENGTVTIMVEQLGQLADTGGFMRYGIRAGKRTSVIWVNIEDEVPPLITPQDAEAYFEAIHYPEQLIAYTQEEVFTIDEVRTIGSAIRLYNRPRNLRFDQLDLEF